MRSCSCLVVLCCSLLLAGRVPAQQAPERVQLASGALQGVAADGVVRFLGVPYAAAPVGALRWRVPQPPVRWEGVREASRYGHACPQLLNAYPDWANEQMAAAGLAEDCLNLNIWAPADPAAEPLPVMVYIHGGNMQFGANAMQVYNGDVLAREGVVVVVINYRLGFLGRFAHPALSRLQADEPLANYGIFDQIAALEWVQQNIAAFGGDPDNVTVFGHSAGGVSVNVLMTTPQSRGLFHRAIAQGSGMLLDRTMHYRQSLPRGLIGRSSEDFGQELAEHFGITGRDDAGTVAALRALSWQDILDYQGNRQRPFNPVVDGKVVVDDIPRVFERGEQHNVPYIGGANSWEWNQIADVPLIGKWFLGGALIEALSEEDLAVFDDQWTRIGLSQRWFAEGLFLSSTRHFAAQMSKVPAPAWQYRGDYVQSAIRGTVPGMAHGVEVAYIFGHVAEHPEYQRPAPAVSHPPSTEDLAWGDTVRAYWLNFARTGNPNGPGLPEWPEYRPDSDLTLVLGEQLEVAAGLDAPVLDFLEQRALLRRAELDAGRPDTVQ